MTSLFFSLSGRLPRATFAGAMLALVLGAAAAFVLLEATLGRASTVVVLPVFYWAWLALSMKRYHDIGKSGAWLLLLLLPVLGPAWVTIELLFRTGTPGENRYGPQPIYAGLDHLQVASPPGNVVDDVTTLNPIEVAAIVVPTTVEEVQDALRRSNGPVSVGGGRFSMGGQTASPGSVHLDMRRLSRVVSLSPLRRTIRVQAGCRWCDVQRVLDAHDLSVKIMQTYANFTVGGSVSVNVHGRYVGQGPLALSVRALSIVLADGALRECSPTQDARLFWGAVGGYGGLGVIVEVELDVTDNVRVLEVTEKLPAASYLEHFRQRVRDLPTAVFHNADLYPPHFSRLRSCTWVKTDEHVTNPRRLMQVEPSHALWRYFFWAISETPFGAWRREFVFEPLSYLVKRIHWRNYEAGYDLAELEPASRRTKTYVLQEYFVPVARFEAFVARMGEVFRRHRVNVLNVSVRHAHRDPGSMLAWAREEVFAFVVYYKQGVEPRHRSQVAVWTREVIEAAVSLGGAYYLPYQAHATPDQLHRAFPRAKELFALKGELDPTFRFRNVIWDTYYAPTLARPDAKPDAKPVEVSEFKAVYSSPRWSDGFFRFLQNIYGLYPDDRFHQLIKDACARHATDEAIYRNLQEQLPSIKPFAAELRLALPALWKQKEELCRQTLELLGPKRALDGYVEIGTTGRYVSELRKHVDVRGRLVLVNDVAPSGSPVDIFERGQLSRLGEFVPLGDYAPLLQSSIADASVDLVTCYIGLHHVPRARLDAFVDSVRRVLRPGGLFIVRDHDAGTPEMKTFVSLVHTVFNAGLGVPWSVDRQELRCFNAVAECAGQIVSRGFRDRGARILQANDPTDNTLMAFEKVEPSSGEGREPGEPVRSADTPLSTGAAA